MIKYCNGFRWNAVSMAKYRQGMFIGRFQPVHNGHIYTVKAALSQCDKLIIGIGSSNKSGTENNPFDANLRIEMLRESLRGAGVDTLRIGFLKIPDFDDDDEWLKFITDRMTGLSVVFSDNPWVTGIFGKAGITTDAVALDRENLSATHMRQLIREGKEWRHMVPEEAHALIQKHSGEVVAAGHPKRKIATV